MKAPPKTAKPNRIDKIDTITRGLGLALRVSYTGSKTWRVLYYVHGQPRTATLGKFPLSASRKRTRRPASSTPRLLARRPKTGTFREVAEDYVLNHVQAEGLRTNKEMVRCLTKYVYPTWGSKPFAEMRRREVSIFATRSGISTASDKQTSWSRSWRD